MKELFLSVLMVSLICSLLLAPLLVFSKKLQGRYAAKTLYFLWLLLAIRMVLPNALVMPNAPVTVEVPGVEVHLPTNPFQPSADMPETQPRPTMETWNTVTATDTYTVIKTVNTVELGVLAAWVWLAGMAVFLLWQMIAYAIARGSILRESIPAVDDEWALLGRLCADLGVEKALNLCRSARVESPMLLGLWSPMVVLPDKDSDPDELEAVLRHELCHLKRGDVAYKSFMLLCNAVHWFNPLVWLMARAASRNVEFCCDDQVLRHADGPTRKYYGEVLLYTAAGSIYPAFSTHFGSGKEQLKERLLNLFLPKKNSALLVCAVAAVALLAGGAVAFESGRSSMPSTAPNIEMPVPTATPMPTPELGPTTYETFYALWPSITGNAISDDYETVTFQVADYDPQNGTIKGTGEERTLTMADDVRLARDVSGNALWAGEKESIERQRALFNFFAWPMLRSTYTAGRTDFVEVIVENGQVSQMALLLTPEIEETDVITVPAPARPEDPQVVESAPNAPVNLPVEGVPKVTVEPLPPDTGDSKTVIDLTGSGQSSIIRSSSFTAKAGQTLTLTITSDISGGTVDLFLFSPAGKEQRITVGGEDATKTITLTEGTWAYNCTGFFESGSVSVVGTVK